MFESRIHLLCYMKTENIDRFLEAQEKVYNQALKEIQGGRKVTHWMWYIFPQIAGLAFSSTSKYYSLKDLQEAQDYLDHPVLGPRLIAISEAVLNLEGKTAYEIFSGDDVKFHSCMTLFSSVENAPQVFTDVLNKYFEGSKDPRTLELIAE